MAPKPAGNVKLFLEIADLNGSKTSRLAMTLAVEQLLYASLHLVRLE
jgi:hypothetical protein